MEIGSQKWKHLIRESAAGLYPDISDEHLERFAVYARELIRWNQTINLTSVTSPAELAVKHFADSLAPLAWIPSDARLLDIGSGGGFPGMVIQIVRPSISATLIDASRKKVSFLNHVIRVLGLRNIRAVHIRAEELAQQQPMSFDRIVSRALSSLDAVISLSLPLLAPHGSILAMKGTLSPSETDAAQNILKQFPDTRSLTIHSYTLPGLKLQRCLVCVGYRPHF